MKALVAQTTLAPLNVPGIGGGASHRRPSTPFAQKPPGSTESVKRPSGFPRRLVGHAPKDTQAFPLQGAHHELDFLKAREKVLWGAVEYIGLFKVNRPEQTDLMMVQEAKDIEKVFYELMKDLSEHRQSLRKTYEDDLAIAVSNLGRRLSSDISLLKRMFERDMSRIRRAARSQLADAVAKVSHAMMRDREEILSGLDELHSADQGAGEELLFVLKKESRHRADDVSKFRHMVSKFQVLMKRNGITDHDSYQVVQDQRVRSEELIESYQAMILANEGRIEEVQAQIYALEKQIQKLFELPPRPNSAPKGRKFVRNEDILMQQQQRRQSSQTYSEALQDARHSLLSRRHTLYEGSQSGDDTGRAEGAPAEALELSIEQIRESYEQKLQAVQREHEELMAKEKEDYVRLDTDYRQRFEALRHELAGDSVRAMLHNNQKKIRRYVTKVYPKPARSVDAEVQCTLDTESKVDMEVRDTLGRASGVIETLERQAFNIRSNLGRGDLQPVVVLTDGNDGTAAPGEIEEPSTLDVGQADDARDLDALSRRSSMVSLQPRSSTPGRRLSISSVGSNDRRLSISSIGGNDRRLSIYSDVEDVESRVMAAQRMSKMTRLNEPAYATTAASNADIAIPTPRMQFELNVTDVINLAKLTKQRDDEERQQLAQIKTNEILQDSLRRSTSGVRPISGELSQFAQEATDDSTPNDTGDE